MKKTTLMDLPVRKRVRRSNARNPFDALFDDLVIGIFCRIGASASSPSDLINLKLTCKRFEVLAMDKFVLAKASGESVWISPKNWSEPARRFLTCCADAGNIEASYYLGMIEFYCHGRHAGGISLITRAAQSYHPEALYTLAVIRFNQSGNTNGSCCQNDHQNAIRLCKLAASICHPDSLREIGYYLQNGRGLTTYPTPGVSYIQKAEEIELQNASGGPNYSEDGTLITNYGFYQQTGRKIHAASRFLIGWWWLMDHERNRERDQGLKLCGHLYCGRRETRKEEFRKCANCRKKVYCSYACQEIDWKMEHHKVCNFEDEFEEQLHILPDIADKV